MKIIKLFEEFSSQLSSNISKDDIKDILLELEETNKVDIIYTDSFYIEESFPLAQNSIIITIRETINWKEDIYETIMRLVDYVGDNLISLSFFEALFIDDIISFTLNDIGNLDINTFDNNIKKIVFRYKSEEDCQKISAGSFSNKDKAHNLIINMSGSDISAINDVLEPYKRYEKDDTHSIMHGKDNPDYKRPTHILNSGFIWYLKDNLGCEIIYINKLNNGFFSISFKSGTSTFAFMVRGLESLINIIRKYGT